MGEVVKERSEGVQNGAENVPPLCGSVYKGGEIVTPPRVSVLSH